MQSKSGVPLACVRVMGEASATKWIFLSPTSLNRRHFECPLRITDALREAPKAGLEVFFGEALLQKARLGSRQFPLVTRCSYHPVSISPEPLFLSQTF